MNHGIKITTINGEEMEGVNYLVGRFFYANANIKYPFKKFPRTR